LCPDAGECTDLGAKLGHELSLDQDTLPESDVHFSFAVAGPVGDIDRDVYTFTQSLTLTLVALGLGLLGAVLVQVRYGLRPLRALRHALTKVRAGEDERLSGSFPAEVQPLVSELNALLDHNAALVERARTQTGNLAHALKNPLTVIMNEARALPEGGDIVREQTAVMRSHIERFLSRARAAGSPSILGACTAVAPIVEDLQFSMDQLYRDRVLQIELEGLHALHFRGDAADLEEMLGNLIDNACKWARGTVKVHGRVTDDHLVITVEDDGSGIAEGERANVLERGRRLDEAIPGTGLGLDIVRDIAALYRGSLELDASALGGVQARLELPAVH
jgi:signal transduction histidine kinase